MKTGLIIGTSELYSAPGMKFNLIHCGACGHLFHTLAEADIIPCMNCHESIEIKKGVKE